MDLRGEVRREARGQCDQQTVGQELRREEKFRAQCSGDPSAFFPCLLLCWLLPPFSQTHLEVDRVHTKDVGVQLAQLSQSTREVVDVLNRIAHSSQDLGAVGTQLLRPMVQVEVREVGLRLRVAAEEPGGSGESASLQVLVRGRVRTLALALGSKFKGYPSLKTYQTENKIVFYTVFKEMK